MGINRPNLVGQKVLARTITLSFTGQKHCEVVLVQGQLKGDL
jgi:hypothetical protein